MKPLKISEINAYINKVLKMDFLLNQVKVVGELTNVNLYPSGHLYLSLKDEHAQLSAIMYQGDVSELNFKPENRMMVEAQGEIRLYDTGGRLQLVIREMKVQGQGDLFETFLKRKEKFEKLGYFDLECKRSVPAYPEKIGIVTSLQGAALQDVLHVLERRNPGIEIIISPASVQGVYASAELITAFKRLDDRDDLDLILLTRGGGSLEDLWSFNDEELIECLHLRKHPIVSAVGHETDTTLIDFVSDLRAPTPSAAAEMITRDHSELAQSLDQLFMDLKTYVNQVMKEHQHELVVFKSSLDQLKNQDYLNYRRLELESIFKSMTMEVRSVFEQQKHKIDAYDPEHLQSFLKRTLDRDRLQFVHQMADVNSKIHREYHRQHLFLQDTYEIFEEMKNQYFTHELTDEAGQLIWDYESLTLGKKFFVHFDRGLIEATVTDRKENR